MIGILIYRKEWPTPSHTHAQNSKAHFRHLTKTNRVASRRSPNDACFVVETVRKVDIAHSGQTVSEALDQLHAGVKSARRGRETVVLVVHGFGASGVGGAIKAALSTELPRLARQYGFKAYGYADKDRIPEEENVNPRSLSPGSTLLILREAQSDKESKRDFRPNFRNLRSKVTVRFQALAATQGAERCQHVERRLVSRGPGGSSYKCRRCGKTFIVPSPVSK